MGWLDKIGFGKTDPRETQRGSSSAPPRPPDSRWRNVKVVGESFRQDNLWAVCGAKNTGAPVAVECIAELVPEPENPHDPRAIRVDVKGQHVGYLPRGSARLYGKRIREMRAAGQPTICDAFIGGLQEGSDNPNLGISLRFPVAETGEYEIQPGGKPEPSSLSRERLVLIDEKTPPTARADGAVEAYAAFCYQQAQAPGPWPARIRRATIACSSGVARLAVGANLDPPHRAQVGGWIW